MTSLFPRRLAAVGASALLSSAVVLATWGAGAMSAQAAGVQMMHVHGLAFSPDGSKLYVPDHHGVAVHAAGRWSVMPGQPDDYMGFAITRAALYSSGHPAPGSNAVNPLGLVKSTDGGRTWRSLGLQGEADFHVMTAGYASGAVYALAMESNSRMPVPGLYGTTDDGHNWMHAAAQGLQGQVFALAAHPTDPRIVAAATRSGLYLSSDGGGHFRTLATGAQFLSVMFDLDGRHLWYGSYDGQTHLTRIAWGSPTEKPSAIALPPMRRDAVAYIAQDPVHRHRLAIATFNRDVYVSEDAGGKWRQVASQGRTD